MNIKAKMKKNKVIKANLNLKKKKLNKKGNNRIIVAKIKNKIINLKISNQARIYNNKYKKNQKLKIKNQKIMNEICLLFNKFY